MELKIRLEQDSRIIDTCHAFQKASIKKVELETVHTVKCRKRVFRLTHIENAVEHPNTHQPFNSLLKVSGSTSASYDTVHELTVLLGKLGNDTPKDL